MTVYTSRHWKPQESSCGDDSILRPNITRTRGCLAWEWWGSQYGGSALLVVSFKYTALLISLLGMSGTAPAPGL